VEADVSIDLLSSIPVNHLLSTFIPNTKIHPIITRAFRPPKPDPAGILHIAEQWGLSNRGTDLIMVRFVDSISIS
jgi:hypothetical protein